MRRPVGGQRLQAGHRVPGRRPVPHVLPREPCRLHAGRDDQPPPGGLLRRERRRHTLGEAVARPGGVRRLDRQQHHLGRERQPQLHAVQGREPRLRGRRPLQGRGRRSQRTPRLQVGRRHPLVAHDRRARHHEGRLRLAEPGVLGLRQGRVPGVPPRLPGRRRRMGQPQRARHQDVRIEGLPELAGSRVAEVLARAGSASSTRTRSSRTTARRTSSSASRPGTPTAAGPSRQRLSRSSTTAGSAAASRSGRARR